MCARHRRSLGGFTLCPKCRPALLTACLVAALAVVAVGLIWHLL